MFICVVATTPASSVIVVGMSGSDRDEHSKREILFVLVT